VALSFLWMPDTAGQIPKPAPKPAPKKRSLLVGISDYQRSDPGGKFDDLNSGNDIKTIASVLAERFHFRDEEIRTLTTKAETRRDNILQEFRRFLIEPTGEGDVIVFYYAGHGSQVEDRNEPDGLDETLVPSDYANDGSRDIRDKEIADLLIALKGRHPATVFLGFDSCHSATAFRGDLPSPFNKQRGMSFQERFGRKKPRPDRPSPTMAKLVREHPLGPGFVVFAASQDD